ETPTPRAAADFVRRDDAEKAGRMRYLYEVDISDPNLYELIVNVEKLPYDAVVEMLAGLVRRPELATAEDGRRPVASRALASRVQVAPATHPDARRYRITVDPQGRGVTRQGPAARRRPAGAWRGRAPAWVPAAGAAWPRRSGRGSRDRGRWAGS